MQHANIMGTQRRVNFSATMSAQLNKVRAARKPAVMLGDSRGPKSKTGQKAPKAPERTRKGDAHKSTHKIVEETVLGECLERAIADAEHLGVDVAAAIRPVEVEVVKGVVVGNGTKEKPWLEGQKVWMFTEGHRPIDTEEKLQSGFVMVKDKDGKEWPTPGHISKWGPQIMPPLSQNVMIRNPKYPTDSPEGWTLRENGGFLYYVTGPGKVPAYPDHIIPDKLSIDEVNWFNTVGMNSQGEYVAPEEGSIHEDHDREFARESWNVGDVEVELPVRWTVRWYEYVGLFLLWILVAYLAVVITRGGTMYELQKVGVRSNCLNLVAPDVWVSDITDSATGDLRGEYGPYLWWNWAAKEFKQRIIEERIKLDAAFIIAKGQTAKSDLLDKNDHIRCMDRCESENCRKLCLRKYSDRRDKSREWLNAFSTVPEYELCVDGEGVTLQAVNTERHWSFAPVVVLVTFICVYSVWGAHYEVFDEEIIADYRKDNAKSRNVRVKIIRYIKPNTGLRHTSHASGEVRSKQVLALVRVTTYVNGTGFWARPVKIASHKLLVDLNLVCQLLDPRVTVPGISREQQRLRIATKAAASTTHQILAKDSLERKELHYNSVLLAEQLARPSAGSPVLDF